MPLVFLPKSGSAGTFQVAGAQLWSAARRSGQERRLNDRRDRKASGSTLSEALLRVAEVES